METSTKAPSAACPSPPSPHTVDRRQQHPCQSQQSTLLRFYALASLLSLSPQRYRRLLVEKHIRRGGDVDGVGEAAAGQQAPQQPPYPSSPSSHVPAPPASVDARAMLNALVAAVVYPFAAAAATATPGQPSSLFRRLSESRPTTNATGAAAGDRNTSQSKGANAGASSPSAALAAAAIRGPTPPAVAINADVFPTPASLSGQTPERTVAATIPATASPPRAVGGPSDATSRAASAAIAHHFDTLHRDVVVSRSPLQGRATSTPGSQTARAAAAAAAATTTVQTGTVTSVPSPRHATTTNNNNEQLLLLSPFEGEGGLYGYVDAHACYAGVTTEQLTAELAEPQFERFYSYMQGGTLAGKAGVHPHTPAASPSPEGKRPMLPAQDMSSVAGVSQMRDGGSRYDPTTGHYVSSSGLPLYAPPEALRRHHQAYLRLLPPILQTSSGVSQASRLCPALLPSILEVLLKECLLPEAAAQGTTVDFLRDSVAAAAASAMSKVTAASASSSSPGAAAMASGAKAMVSGPPSPSSSGRHSLLPETSPLASIAALPPAATGTPSLAPTTKTPEVWTSARRAVIHLLERYAPVLAAQQRHLRRLRRRLWEVVLRLLETSAALSEGECSVAEEGQAAAEGARQELARFIALSREVTEEALPLAHALDALRTTAVCLLPVMEPSSWAIQLAATTLLARVFPYLDHINDDDGEEEEEAEWGNGAEEERTRRPSMLQETDKLLVYGPVVEDIAIRQTALSKLAAPLQHKCDAVGLVRLRALLLHIAAVDQGESTEEEEGHAAGTSAASGGGGVWDIDEEALGVVAARCAREKLILVSSVEQHAQEVAQDVSAWTSYTALVFCFATAAGKLRTQRQDMAVRRSRRAWGGEGEGQGRSAAGIPPSSSLTDASTAASTSQKTNGADTHRVRGESTTPSRSEAAGGPLTGSVIAGPSTPLHRGTVVTVASTPASPQSPGAPAPLPAPGTPPALPSTVAPTLLPPALPTGAIGSTAVVITGTPVQRKEGWVGPPTTVAGAVVPASSAVPYIVAARDVRQVISRPTTERLQQLQQQIGQGGGAAAGRDEVLAATVRAGSVLAQSAATGNSAATPHAAAAVSTTAPATTQGQAKPSGEDTSMRVPHRRLVWRLPERVPAQVTPTHMAILASMTLTLPNGADGKTASHRTVAALGQWFVQSLVMHLADTAAAVAEAHHHHHHSTGSLHSANNTATAAVATSSSALSAATATAAAGGLPVGKSPPPPLFFPHGNRLPTARVSSACVALTHLLQQHLSFFAKAVLGGGTLASLRTIAASTLVMPSPVVLPQREESRNGGGGSEKEALHGVTHTPSPPTPPPPAPQSASTSYNINLNMNTLLKGSTDNSSSNGSGTTPTPAPAPTSSAAREHPAAAPILIAAGLGNDSTSSSSAALGGTARITDVLVRLSCLLALRLLQQQSTALWNASNILTASAPSAVERAYLSELHELSYVLHLLLQSVLTHQAGEPFSVEAQQGLASLFLSWIHLLCRHLDHSVRQRSQRDGEAAPAAQASSPMVLGIDARTCLVSDFHWLVLTVDHVLHSYDKVAGSPLVLCTALAPLAQRMPAAAAGASQGPNRTVFDTLRRILLEVAGSGGGSSTTSSPPPPSSAVPHLLSNYVLPALHGIEAVATAALFIVSPSETPLPASLRLWEYDHKQQQQQEEEKQPPAQFKDAGGARSQPDSAKHRLFLDLSSIPDDDGDGGVPVVLSAEEATEAGGGGCSAEAAPMSAQMSATAADGWAERKRFLKAKVLSAEEGSLVGVLPCSSEPFTLHYRRLYQAAEHRASQEGSRDGKCDGGKDGEVVEGLWPHQCVDWAVSFLNHLDRQWWFARANVSTIGIAHASTPAAAAAAARRQQRQQQRPQQAGRGEEDAVPCCPACPMLATDVWGSAELPENVSPAYLDGCLTTLWPENEEGAVFV